MAKCEEGYRCSVCGEDVEDIRESSLYLRYVLGMIDPETLHATPDRHLRCDEALAQFVVDPEFPPIERTSGIAKRDLDPAFVAEREAFVTRGWRRLQELFERLQDEEISVLDYPLPEITQKLRGG